MIIHLNNIEEEFDADDLTISQLMFLKRFSNKMMIVKLNGGIIKKNDWSAKQLKQGDKLDIIRIINGG
jgi:sulfur carrier protein